MDTSFITASVTEGCVPRPPLQDEEGVVLWYLWGLNPRRLKRLADLKSAPLDHSGKIPGKINERAPACTSFLTAFITCIDPSSASDMPLLVGRLLSTDAVYLLARRNAQPA